jgi:hypothetical protein
MAEKGLTKRDLEQVFTGLEKRQDKKLKGLEGRVHSELKGIEERVDSRFKDFEERVDLKLKNLGERVVNQLHIISEGLIDQIKLLAEGHAGIIERLTLMEKENERQHLETRSLVKLSFTEMDRRLTDLETQMKEMQDWKKQVEGRLQI